MFIICVRGDLCTYLRVLGSKRRSYNPAVNPYTSTRDLTEENSTINGRPFYKNPKLQIYALQCWMFYFKFYYTRRVS